MYTYTYDTESLEFKGIFTIQKDNGTVIMFIIDVDPNTTNDEHILMYEDMKDLDNRQRFVDLLVANPGNAFLTYLSTRPI